MIPEVFECPRCERQFVIDSVPDTGSEEVHCPQCSRFLGVRDIAFVLRTELDEMIERLSFEKDRLEKDEAVYSLTDCDPEMRYYGREVSNVIGVLRARPEGPRATRASDYRVRQSVGAARQLDRPAMPRRGPARNRRSRRRAVSFPRSSTTSKSGAPTVTPVRARRTGWISFPAETPPASAVARRAASVDAARPLGAGRRTPSARASSCRAGVRPDVLLEAVGVVIRGVHGVASKGPAPSRSASARAGRCSSIARSATASGGTPAVACGRERARSSAAGIFAMYCWFIQRSFSGSKTEGDAPTRSRVNSRSISSRERISRSPPGAQPSRARKLKSASGRMPASRHSSTAAAPWRLESFFLSVPRIMPRCANVGNRRAERAKERDVLGRVGEVVVPPDDVRDAHLRVVHADAEVVQRVPVGAHEDEIVQGLGRELDAAADQVVDDDRLVRHPQAHDVPLAGLRAPVALVRRDVPARARVTVGAPRRLGGLALAVELLRRLEGPIGLAFADQPVGGLAVEVVAPRLVEGALVVLEPEPLHGREDLGRELLPRALDVRVLDAEDERSLLVPREEKVVERRARAADVQRARRRGREADAGIVGGIQGGRSYNELKC